MSHLKLSHVFLAVSVGFLTSCAPYVAPTPGQPAATIKNYDVLVKTFNGESATIEKIDNKYTTYGTDVPIAVSPGPHTFTVVINFTHGFTDDNHNDLVDLNAAVKAGHQYQLKLQTNKDQYNVSIVDSNGESIASSKSSAYVERYVPTSR